MQQYFSIILFIVGFAFFYLFIRKDVDEEKRMTKKGFVKFLSVMVLLFLITFSLVFLMER
ncbi:hypothetical protein [Oceanobacillus kapialis]|uniref:DUF3976 domain-containing protein n=1 Tax=Oceanobacillus kapialis TaxID=481353 RepID=A0ABW5Q2R0_9BACI